MMKNRMIVIRIQPQRYKINYKPKFFHYKNLAVYYFTRFERIKFFYITMVERIGILSTFAE